MSKEMYDEKERLKPEYAWTKEEKDILLNGALNEDKEYSSKLSKLDDNSLKKELKNYFYRMQNYIMMNRISFSDFETYYSHLLKGISTGMLDDYLPFALTLTNSTVLIMNDGDETKLNGYKKQLDDLIASEVRKGLAEEGIDLVRYFEEMKHLTRHSVIITLEQYYEYCDYFRLAIMAKDDRLDYLNIARALQNAHIYSLMLPNTYAETIKINSYQKFVNDYVMQLEQDEKDKRKK